VGSIPTPLILAPLPVTAVPVTVVPVTSSCDRGPLPVTSVPMKDKGGLDSDLPQLPDPGGAAISARVEEVNELVRHLWNALHGLNHIAPDNTPDEILAARVVVRDLKREIMQSIERLPADYARVYNSAVIAVYSLLR
jgi:hypothetical protein